METSALDMSPAAVWKTIDYAGISPVGSGIPTDKQRAAGKLADSAVAPLVAVARGYRGYTDIADASRVQQLYGVTGRHAEGRCIKEMLEESDILYMPWYTVNDVLRDLDGDTTALEPASAVQIRPGKPTPDANGRFRKYLMPKGSRIVIGIHPALPREHITNPDTIFITEGLLKGDASLTGYLISCGVPVEDLEAPRDDDGVLLSQADAITRLRALMTQYCDATDADDNRIHPRLFITTLLGVGTWHKNASEWNSTPVSGRDVWVAFDGDITENRHVWSQAKRLDTFLGDRGATQVSYIVPTAPAGATGLTEKLGVDDFLAAYGTFDDLINHRTDTLPPQPPLGEEDLIGRTLVADDGASIVTYKRVEAPDGTSYVAKETVVDYGARIDSLITRRQTTLAEERTGTFGTGVDHLSTPMKKFVEATFAWHPRTADGGYDDETIETGHVVAPEKILNYTPDQWDRHDAVIDTSILMQPNWPPKDGRAFNTAMREASAYGAQEYRTVTEWMQMGWVPQDNGDPVFIVGDQILSRDGVSDTTRSGLIASPNYRRTASRFGFGDCDGHGQWEERGHTDGDAFRAYARGVFREVVRIYLQSGLWPDAGSTTESGIAPLIVGAGLRPCIPLADRVSVFFSGTAGSGKSWSAAAITAFWQREPGSFSHQKLPGSANDTFAFTEDMAHHFPLWVIDDLAPVPDKIKAGQDATKLEDIVRAKHSKHGKGRSTIGGGDIRPGASKHPRALLVITAENDLKTTSAMQRTLPIPLRSGGLGSREATQELVNLRERTTLPSQLSAIVVGYIQWQIAQSSWTEVVEHYVRQHEEATRRYVDALRKDTGGKDSNLERPAEIIADVVIALELLGQIARELDLNDEIIDLFDTKQIPARVRKMFSEVQRAERQRKRGWAFIDAIRRALRSGHAHIIDHDDPNVVPTVDDAQKDVPYKLGWYPTGVAGEYKPRGSWIGTLRYDQDSERYYIAIEPEDAFAIIKRHYGDTIVDTSHHNSVRAVHDEQLLTDLVPIEKGRKTAKVTVTTEAKKGGYERGQKRVMALDADLILDPEAWRARTGYDIETPEEDTDDEW